MPYNPDNIFAKILRGEIPCQKMFENDHVLAFHDIAPAAPVHILVLPKGRYVSFNDFTQNASPKLQNIFWKAVQTVAATARVDETGYRLITNHGADASQSVPHFHVHILGGRSLGGLVPDDITTR